MDSNEFDGLILVAAERYEVPPELIKGCIAAESNFKPTAGRYEDHRDDTSLGLMQLLTATVGDMGLRSADDLLDPETNIDYGTRYLRKQYDRFPEIRINGTERWRFSVAAYNAGRGNINKALKLARTTLGLHGLDTDGLWQEWWFTHRFLHTFTGKNAHITIHHVDRVWEAMSRAAIRGDFR